MSEQTPDRAPFRGKVVIVTGATSGIGRAAAIRFAAEGARVVVSGRREEEGMEAVAAIAASGGEASFCRTDVRDAASVEALVAFTIRKYSRLDCAFNNAGIGGESSKRVADQDEQVWDEVLRTNLKGTWLCMKHEIPAMLRSGGGAIVNNSSVLGRRGSALGIAPYVASKHGILGLTKAAAMEYAREGIRVNAVCPGYTAAGLAARGLSAAGERFMARVSAEVPMGRLAEADEIARVVLWLCSPDAAFVTGESVAVDGGWAVG